MKDTSPVTITRTWEVALYGSYGEGSSARVYLGTRTVTLSGGRSPRGQLLPIVAQVNGCEVSEVEAVSLLNWAKAEGRVTLLSEQRIVPTIGKRRACELHRLMSHAGIPSGEHYGFAGVALDRPVFSLATLTQQEARLVWHFLQHTHSTAA
ncbi:hypothetical protein [Deinococcus apachensis]|uniref:hypothetical protein n=1 Tax=Deinococcus apachensis TaxID=309886 RepID=UPI00036B2BC4|nr:hypothetical protein [Deinococcus apachensis]